MFDDVLAVADGDDVAFGQPAVDGALVRGKVVVQGKGKKIRVFKYKSKSNYRRSPRTSSAVHESADRVDRTRMISVAIQHCRDAVRGIAFTGHADYAEAGEDIVCAAASALALTTALGFQDVLQASGEYRAEEGEIAVTLDQPTEHSDSLMKTMLADCGNWFGSIRDVSLLQNDGGETMFVFNIQLLAHKKGRALTRNGRDSQPATRRQSARRPVGESGGDYRSPARYEVPSGYEMSGAARTIRCLRKRKVSFPLSVSACYHRQVVVRPAEAC